MNVKNKQDRRNGVNRRELLQIAASSGAAVVASPLLALTHGGSAVPTSGDDVVPAFEFEEVTVSGLRKAMESGTLTARQLTQSYLDRIAALDRAGPALHAIIEVNPEALAIADALDAERKAKGPRGPLHGIPVVIKDNIATADRMETTAGSLALLGSKVPRDAFIAAKLREAGAVIIGKTNLSEWANFRSNQSSSGWSARGGQCKNPYALDRSPCGSSSGTGAAIAANLAVVGVGTETDGSIVCPAGMCSLVGIKPTVGLVSRSGIVPISHSQDTAGPMTRTVADAAMLLDVLMGKDSRDKATAAIGSARDGSFTRFLDSFGLKGARIGVARKKYFGYSPQADGVIEEAIEEIARAGAVVIDPIEIPHDGEYDDAEFEVLLYEFKADLAAYFAELTSSSVRSIKDVIEFNDKNRDREMPYFGQETMLLAEKKGPLTDKAYLKAREKCIKLSRTQGLDVVMAKHQLDAILAPTGSPPWTIDLVNGDHFIGASSTPAAVSGYPSITLPAGYVFGLPVGLTLIGKPWGEGTLIRLAYAFEQATKHRRPPRFLPTADLSKT